MARGPFDSDRATEVGKQSSGGFNVQAHHVGRCGAERERRLSRAGAACTRGGGFAPKSVEIGMSGLCNVRPPHGRPEARSEVGDPTVCVAGSAHRPVRSKEEKAL